MTTRLDGNNNVQTIGNNNSIDNSVNFHLGDKISIAPSKLFRLLKIVATSNNYSGVDFDLDLPEELLTKLNFNNAQKYVMIFEGSVEDYVTLGNILETEFPDGEKIIRSVRNIFIKKRPKNQNGEIIKVDGDYILNEIYDTLEGQIVKSSDYIQNPIDIEDVEQFINALLQYCVIKCKVLDNPNRLEKIE